MRDIAVCLLSGGLDSCVAATTVEQSGSELYFLSIDWGQTLVRELESARKISDTLQPSDHEFLDLNAYNRLSRSALTEHQSIPSTQTLERNVREIPVTYPPGRDPSFIMIASSWLESIMLDHIAHGREVSSGQVVIGTNKEDSMVYPDCDAEVYRILNRMFSISTKISREHGIPLRVSTPLIDLTKKEVLERGVEIGAPVELSYSCYRGEESLCGTCDPCRIIYFAFEDLRLENPFKYQQVPTKRYSGPTTPLTSTRG